MLTLGPNITHASAFVSELFEKAKSSRSAKFHKLSKVERERTLLIYYLNNEKRQQREQFAFK